MASGRFDPESFRPDLVGRFVLIIVQPQGFG